MPSCLFSLPFSGAGIVFAVGRTVVLTGTTVVMERLLTGQLTAPGGHLVSVYVDVESGSN